MLIDNEEEMLLNNVRRCSILMLSESGMTRKTFIVTAGVESYGHRHSFGFTGF